MIPTTRIMEEILKRTDISRETRAVLDLVSIPLTWPLLLTARCGDRHPVLILPGFGGDDTTYIPLHAYLGVLGYRTYGWTQGPNMGPTPRTGQRIIERLHEIYERGGEKVSLVGQSVGGIYARELARKFPEKVRQVICLGSPVNQPMTSRILDSDFSMNDWDEWRKGLPMASREEPISMPCTQIYSRGDGLVTEDEATLVETPLAQNVHIDSTHSGMGFNSLAYYVIADRLATPVDAWKPFRWPPSLQWLVLASHSLAQCLDAFHVPRPPQEAGRM